MKYLLYCALAITIITSDTFGAAPAEKPPTPHADTCETVSAYIKRIRSQRPAQNVCLPAKPEIHHPTIRRCPQPPYVNLVTFWPTMSDISNEDGAYQCTGKNADIAIWGLRDMLEEENLLDMKSRLILASKKAHADKLINKTTTTVWGVTAEGEVTLLETVINKNLPKMEWILQ